MPVINRENSQLTMSEHIDGTSGKPKTKKIVNLASSLIIASTLLAGCGGGGSSDSTSSESAAIDNSATETQVEESASAETGVLTLAITDAEGDFVSYTVDVLSIELTKADGSIVETVPLSTRVDFAQYAEMTEFFNIATIPAGIYTSANLVLDYSNSDIIVQDADGNSTPATAVDSEGDTLTQLTVAVTMNEDAPLRIARGVPASLTLDFDLDSSNEVTSYNPTVVAVEPVLLADVELVENREHRARGLLKSVDTDEATFSLKLLPFRHRTGSFGEFSFSTSADTHYEINGEVYEGTEGLAAMNTLEVNTPVIAQGNVTIDTDALRNSQLSAQFVYAGSSVPWSDRDVVHGTVIARTGDSLTVRGRFAENESGGVTFDEEITVTISDETVLTQQGSDSDALTPSSVSIGQRVVVFGDLTSSPEDSDTDASSDEASETEVSYTLDATTGHLRLMMNLIKGTVQSVDPLVLDLKWINGRNPENFNFDGTGFSEDNDADQDNYEIDTSTLSLSSIEENAQIRIRGFANEFGTAPADFNAQTIIDINEEGRGAALGVLWSDPGSTTPFTEISQDKIVVNLNDTRASVKIAGIRRIDNNDHETVTLLPTDALDDNKRTLYAIKSRADDMRSVTQYREFADFVDGLNAALASGKALKKLEAKGHFDLEDVSMETPTIKAIFK